MKIGKILGACRQAVLALALVPFLAVAAAPEAAAQQTTTNGEWVACSKKNETCVLPDTGLFRISYGNSGMSRFADINGVAEFRCSEKMGDDFIDADKAVCKYIRITNDEVSETAVLGKRGPFRNCAAEDGDCAVDATAKDNAVHHVRFGQGDNWVYGTASGNFKCSNDYFGLDPAAGKKKSCEVGAGVVPPSSFKECASENNACNLRTKRENYTLLRYGTAGKWVYRTLSGATGHFYCATNNVGFDPAPGKRKHCQYYTLPVDLYAIQGDWVDEANCTGCTTTSDKLTTKTQQTDSNTRTKELAKSLKISVTGSYNKGSSSGLKNKSGTKSSGGSSDYSGEATVTGEISQKTIHQVARVLERSQTLEIANECKARADNPVGVSKWRYAVSIMGDCPDGGICTTQLHLPTTCVQGIKKPACTPGCASNKDGSWQSCSDEPACKVKS